MLTNATDDLITWLRAAFDEDERLARAGHGVDFDLAEQPDHPGMFDVEAYRDGSTGTFEVVSGPGGIRAPYVHHIVRWDPARMLAEVDVKRRIVAHIGAVILSPWTITLPDGYVDDLTRILRLLALPYSDREGYREEWRP
jgi:hypothetical protein